MTDIDLSRIQNSFFSRHWRWRVEAQKGLATTCLEELKRRLPHIAEDSWPERFALGGIYVAGHAAQPSTQVVAPCSLEYYEPKFDLHAADSFYPQFQADWILHQDEDIGVVYKPAGLPTSAARDQQRFFLNRYLAKHVGLPVHTPSRLDTAVSGILLFSLSPRANRWFQRAYEGRRIEKYYLCEVGGCPEWEVRHCSRALTRDERHPVLRRVTQEGGEEALTSFRCLHAYHDGSRARALLQAEPLTGRTHQIRVHAQSEGYPIEGDPLYGGGEAPQLRLVSAGLRFHHPFRNTRVEFQLPLALRPSWLQDIERHRGTTAIRFRSEEGK